MLLSTHVLQEGSKKLLNAGSVVVVGGGPTGVELAAEVCLRWCSTGHSFSLLQAGLLAAVPRASRCFVMVASLTWAPAPKLRTVHGSA